MLASGLARREKVNQHTINAGKSGVSPKRFEIACPWVWMLSVYRKKVSRVSEALLRSNRTESFAVDAADMDDRR